MGGFRDSTNNTPETIARNEMVVDITCWPRPWLRFVGFRPTSSILGFGGWFENGGLHAHLARRPRAGPRAHTARPENQIYGERRRMGKMGHQRSTNDALRAVHWEDMAARKQRSLSRQLGVHVSDADFNREHNTVMHDAVYRATTGRFTNPDQEGFHPHPHAIPLDHSMNLIRAHADRIGLGHPDETFKQRLS